jgi:menaquinone-dependent protoporphyrinogen oxidase
MNHLYTYHIQVRGQVSETDVNASSPLQITVNAAGPDVTELTAKTDQPGIIGVVRHLHGRGFTVLSINSDEAVSPAVEASPKHMSRRSFLKTGGIIGATAAVTAVGTIAMAPDPSPIYLSSFTFGDNTMNNRILIAYATATGSTIDVAAAIGETLGKNGFAVDVSPIKDNPSLNDYDAILIGSAVQHGSWLPEALDFVKDNQQGLAQMPVALFCVHITNLGSDDTSRKNRLAFLDNVCPYVQPVDEAFFAGRFNRDGAKLMLPGWLVRFVPTLDFRRWGKIRAWADDLAPKLSQTMASSVLNGVVGSTL